jgi:transcriptional regulator GlxA family with amidase domain
MDRRTFVTSSLAAVAAAGLPGSVHTPRAAASRARTTGASDDPIPVAFVISQGANVIDLAGAWEVFQDVMLGDPNDHASHREGFSLYTVSDSPEPVRATGGLTLVPTYTLAEAPPPRVVSIGAQRGSDPIHEWLRAQAETADVVMSVCTGAFHLGHAGLLAGKRATTHHDYWDAFAEEFPDVELVRGSRFVVNGNIMTAGGLTSGIDLALHVVEQFYGRDTALATATYMEYESRRWMEG